MSGRAMRPESDEIGAGHRPARLVIAQGEFGISPLHLRLPAKNRLYINMSIELY